MKILLLLVCLVAVCWAGPGPHRRDEEDVEVETIVEVHHERDVEVRRDGHQNRKPEIQNSCPNQLSLLYALYGRHLDTLYYTPIYDDMVWRGVFKGDGAWEVRKPPGLVSVTSTDCHCNPKGYKAAHLLNGPGGTGGRPAGKWDHFYTIDEVEMDHMKRTASYQNVGPWWYCSPEKDHCGASIPLMRYSIRNLHAYVSTEEDGNKLLGYGAKYDGVVCYIWPNPATPDRFLQNNNNGDVKNYYVAMANKNRGSLTEP